MFMPYFFVLLVGFFLFNPMAVSAQQENDMEGIQDPYKFVRIVNSPVTQTLSLRAEVMPRKHIEIQAPRDGKIMEVLAIPGEVIGHGSTLAILDDSDLRMQREKLQAERQELSAHLRRIEGLVSQNQVDAEIWERNVHKLTQIRAEIAILDEKIERSRIQATQRGAVIWEDVKSGQEVKGAQPLFWVGDPEDLWLKTTLDAELAKDVKSGNLAAIFPSQAEDGSQPISGAVEFIEFQGPNKKTLEIYVKTSRAELLNLNQTYEMLIALTGEREKLVIPEEALVEDQYAFLVRPVGVEPDKYFLSKIRLETKPLQHGIVEVNSQYLMPGDQVLINPPKDLEHGIVIKAIAAKSSWRADYTTLALASSRAACSASGEKSANGAACNAGGGCGASGPVTEQTAIKNNAEARMCLVPDATFAQDEEPEFEPPPPDHDMRDNGPLPYSDPVKQG